MQVPATLKGDYLKRLLQGAAAGAAIITVLGFWQFGWVTGGTAKSMESKAKVEATTAALLVPCQQQFTANADAMAKFRAETSTYSRERIVRETVVKINGASPSSSLIDECSAAVTKGLTAAAAAKS